MTRRTVAAEMTRLLGTPRLAPYLAESGGDVELALSLYRWNLELAAAFQEVLSVVEVVVRNAIDEQLRVWNSGRGFDSNGVAYPADWLIQPAPPVKGLLSNALRTAHQHADRARGARVPGHPRKLAPISHDDLLCQLSFSVWRKMLPASAPNKVGLQQLWSQALVKAFPLAAAGSVTQVLQTPGHEIVHTHMDRLVGLRNRVAHMESLLTVNVPARLSDCFHLLGYVSPQARDWCAGVSRVTEVNGARPHTGAAAGS